MIQSFSANNVLVPVPFLILKGAPKEELMDLIQINEKLPGNIRHFVKIEVDGEINLLYNSIPLDFRRRFFLPEPDTMRGELELYFKCPPEKREISGKDSRYQLISQRLVEAYRYNWPDFAQPYFDFTHRLDKVEYYAKKHACFDVCFRFHLQYAFPINDIYRAFNPFATTFLKKISLDRFYKIFEMVKGRAWIPYILVHKSLGREKENANFTSDAKKIAFDEYTDRNKKFPEILETVNQFLDDQGCCSISKSTLQRYFADPRVNNLVLLKRNRGDIDGDGFFPYLDRLRCSKRNMQWQMDTDTMPVEGHDGTKYLTPKYIAVVDNSSGDVLGYSYCQAENGASAIEALRMAVYTTGCLPYELLTDNGPGFDSDEFKAILARAKFYGCRHRQARLKNAKDKTVIEGTFRSIHAVWRSESGYKGHRVKAVRRDSFPNEEYKSLAKKAEYMYDNAGLAALLPEIILKYRNHSFSGKPTTKQRYDNSQTPDDRILEQWKIAKMFWVAEQMDVKGNRIVFRYNRNEFKFRILNTRLGLLINDEPVMGRFNHFDPSKLLLFDLRTDIFIAELTAHESIHTLEEEMSEYDKYEFASYNKKLQTMKLETAEMLAEKKEEVKEVLKRTGFKKKKVKHEHDPNAAEAMEEYYNIHGLDRTPAKRVKQIRITELDKISNDMPKSTKRFNKLEIIDDI